MTHRRAILAVLTGMVLLAYAFPALGGSLTVFRLEPSSGWVALPPDNPYATAVRENPHSGWGNAATSSLVKATARFEPDMRKAELTVDFVPVSRDIRPNGGNLFVVPLGRRLEWKLVITVRNPNDIPMKRVRVRDEFGPGFRATLAGRPAGDARIEGDDPRGMLPMHPTLVWDIGDLAPGQAARAEVTVVTSRDGSGNQQFSRPGIYSIDTGARLTYVLAGPTQIRNTSSGSAIARKDVDALRGDALPFDVGMNPIVSEGTGAGPVAPSAPPIVGQGPRVRAVIRRADQQAGTRTVTRPTSYFSLVAASVTSNITDNGDKFAVPAGEYAEWEVTVTITNPDDPGWTSWNMAIDFGAELSVEEIPGTRDIIPPPGGSDPGTGNPLAITRDLSTGQARVAWEWSGASTQFAQGAQAVVRLKVYATSPTGYGTLGEYVFSDDTTLTFVGTSTGGSILLSPIYVVAGPAANITLSATRLDWRVRKPGTYAALATEMSFTGTGRLSVQFSGFENLARQDGGTAAISTWYGFGQDPAAMEPSGWITADDLNLPANWRGPITLDPTTPTTLRMWSKINVGEEDPSCEYEDVGVITFIVSNN